MDNLVLSPKLFWKKTSLGTLRVFVVKVRIWRKMFYWQTGCYRGWQGMSSLWRKSLWSWKGSSRPSLTRIELAFSNGNGHMVGLGQSGMVKWLTWYNWWERMCVDQLIWGAEQLSSHWSGANSTSPLPPLLSLLCLLQALSSPFQSCGRARWASIHSWFLIIFA